MRIRFTLNKSLIYGTTLIMQKTLLSLALASTLMPVVAESLPADLEETNDGAITLSDTIVRPEYVEIERLRQAKEIIVINKDQIQEQGNRTVSDVLAKVPSITVGATGQGAIDIRGQGVDQAQRNIQVLLDGAPITTLVNHPMQTNYDVIPVEDLERIDIIPGGGSVLYGSGASGGIINLTSSLNSMKNPESTLTGEWNSKGYRAGATAGTTFADGQGAVQFTANRLDRDLHFVDTFRRSNYYSAGLRYSPTPSQQFVLRASHLDEESQYINTVNLEKLKRYGTQYRPSPGKRTVGVDAKGKKIVEPTSGYIYGDRRLDTVGLTHRWDINDRWQATNDLFYNQGYYQGNEDEERKMDTEGFGVRSKLNWKYNEHGEILFGLDAIRQTAELHYDDYTYNSKKRGYEPVSMAFDYEKDLFGFYALNTNRWGKWEVSEGVRRELTRWHFDKTGKASEGSGSDTSRRWNNAFELSVAYLYRDTGRVYARYERGYTVPDGIQIADTIRMPDKSRRIVASGVDDETFNLFEVGWREAFDWTTASVTLWYSETDNQISRYYPTSAYGMNFKSINLLDTKRWGADVSLSQTVGPFTFEESYAYLMGKTTCSNTAICRDINHNPDYTDKGLKKVPKHKVTLRANWAIRDDLSAEVLHVYQGKYTNFTRAADQDDGFMKSYSLTNISLKYRPNRHWQIYGGVTNLFDKTYYEYGEGSPNYLTVVPGPGRQYFIGMKAIW